MKKNARSCLLGGIIGLCVGSIVGSLNIGDKGFSLQKDFDTSNQKIMEEEFFENVLESLQDDNIPLSTEAEDAIRKISAYTVDNEFSDILEINKERTADAYGRYFTTLKETKDSSLSLQNNLHSNHKYYNFKDQTIDWDGLIDKIYENSLLKVDEKNAEQKRFADYECFSKEEIIEKVENLKTLTSNIKKDFPNYDLEKLACKLENYSFIKTDRKNETATKVTLATTNMNTVAYYNYDSREKTDQMRSIDFHEDFHIIARGCSDELQSLTSHPFGSVNVVNSFLTNEQEEDKLYLDRYNFSFLEEIYAELYSAECNNTVQNSYFQNDEVLELLQMTLGLNDSYEMDDILKDIVYQDPRSFIEHLKLPEIEKDPEQYYLDTLKMIKCYDILLNNNYESLELDKEEGELKDTNKIALGILSTAQRQICKLFFNNLIMMNEKHKEEMTLDQNITILKMFNVQYNNTQFAIKETNGNLFEKANLNTDDIWTETRDIYLNYLCERYQMNETELNEKMLSDTLQEGFPDFMGNDKKEYYSNVFKNQDPDWTLPSSRQLVKENRR